MQKKAEKIIEKDFKPENDTSSFLSDEPQPKPEEAAAEPEPEPESTAEENEISTSETKYSKSQSITKSGSNTRFNAEIFFQLVTISLSTVFLNAFA